MGPADAIRDLVEPPLVAGGFELWDVEVVAAAVRVLVDRPGGIDLDGVAEASNLVSPLLDEHAELTPGGRYELEVSSPGIERTLRTVGHLRKYLGAQVGVKTTAAVNGARRLQGSLTGVDDEAITLALDQAPAGATAVRIPHAVIQRTRTVPEWDTPAKPPKAPWAPKPPRIPRASQPRKAAQTPEMPAQPPEMPAQPADAAQPAEAAQPPERPSAHAPTTPESPMTLQAGDARS